MIFFGFLIRVYCYFTVTFGDIIFIKKILFQILLTIKINMYVRKG